VRLKIESDKVYLPHCFITLIEVKLLQQLKDWFVRFMEKILCLLLSMTSIKELEMVITTSHVLVVQTKL